MARIARKSLESLYFHVIVQGYEKQYIFDKDMYKDEYLKLLLSEISKFNVEILEYCIMSNHAHILLYCDNIEQMSKYMKNVNMKYAKFYNEELDRVGYVFRDRFLSEPIKNERHLFNCIPYIHMNPVMAKIVDSPYEYKYSSYKSFLSKSGIVTDSVLIKLFGSNENYMELFKFIHMTNGSGMEYNDDLRTNSVYKSKEIIENILYDFCLLKSELNDYKIQKYFYKLFLKNGVKAYHIEKVLNVNRRKVAKILQSD